MKKLSLLLLTLFLFSGNLLSHKQHVHQRLSIEGYGLLKNWLGRDIPTMLDRLIDNTGGSPNPWEIGKITTGAWREDVVYKYSLQNPPAVSGFTANLLNSLAWALGNDNLDGFISSTHFWYADNGDDVATNMYGAIIARGTSGIVSGAAVINSGVLLSIWDPI
ncbi:MAG: hypothetical protein K8H86_09595 [Ignavibacteriaceae bacterium]|nr:hypothetical protein [Ignavibacteriaceae bacterium]